MTTTTNEEVDRLVAEKVMGWPVVPRGDVHPDEGPWPIIRTDPLVLQYRTGPYVLWSPTTNPSDDYRVLEHVRETWGLTEMFEFDKKMFVELDRRVPDGWSAREEEEGALLWHLFYQPGDYARAALAALEDSDDS